MSSVALAAALEQSLGSAARQLRPVRGGDINQSFEVVLDDGRHVFVKTCEHRLPDMYTYEAEGLAYLEAAGALRVPRVLAVTQRFLALEWITSGARGKSYDEQLGRGLAQLHAFGAASFGFAHDNVIALLPQSNAPTPTWPQFYVERRLLPLAENARRMRLINSALHARLAALCSRIDTLCGATEPPARLHGDLWSGNVMADESGAPVLIDPAIYGGDREVDLAMLQLFGAPSARFFAAYDEVCARTPGAQDRVALYQLYPLLVHVLLFGASYVGQLDRALGSYE